MGHIKVHGPVCRSIIYPVTFIVHGIPSIRMGIPVPVHAAGDTHEPGILQPGVMGIGRMVCLRKIAEPASFIIINIACIGIGLLAGPHRT